MKYILFSIYLIGIYLHGISSMHCTTADGVSGSCVRAHKCKIFADLRDLPYELLTLQDYLLITYSGCKSNGQLTNTICCPHDRPKLANIVPTACVTAEGQIGTCMNIHLCPATINELYTQITKETLTYYEAARCGNMESYSFCCQNELLHTKVVKPQITQLWERDEDESVFRKTCVMSAQPPDPGSECCGIHGDEERIIGGSVTGIDEYPWLALIEYKMKYINSIEPGCGGSLISGRYVLTAGHCLTGDLLNNAKPVSVRLGEYDLSNVGPDCVDTPGGGEDCTNGPITIPIKNIVLHEQYNPTSNNRYHDIALIRLSKTAPYTDFIRPICLPSFDLTLNPPEDLKLYASGWGMSDHQKTSNVKLAVGLPYRPLSECQSIYNEINVSLWRGQICAGGENGRDSCKGDSGGPLMFKNRQTPYTVAAIISYGAKPCGQKDVPSVYTNVYVYLSWIYDHIKP